MSKSNLEAEFETYLKHVLKLFYVREFSFAKDLGYKYRADFYIPEYNLLVEIEGGIYTGGRHNSTTGIIKDCDKYNFATLLGYKLLRFTSDHVKRGDYRAIDAFINKNNNSIKSYF